MTTTEDPSPSDIGGPCALFGQCGNFVHSRSELCSSCVDDLRETRNEFYDEYDKGADKKGREPEQAFYDWVVYGKFSDSEKEYLLFIDRILKIR